MASNKILGFEGLADGLPEGHEDEWPTIRLARLLATHNMIDNEKIVDDDDAEREMKNKMEELRKNMYSRMTSVEVDDDFDDWKVIINLLAESKSERAVHFSY